MRICVYAVAWPMQMISGSMSEVASPRYRQKTVAFVGGGGWIMAHAAASIYQNHPLKPKPEGSFGLFRRRSCEVSALLDAGVCGPPFFLFRRSHSLHPR